MKIKTVACLAFSLLPSSSIASEHQIPLGGGQHHEAPRQRKVAIIGAGAAGASTAYHLAQYAQLSNIPLHITIYERNPYIGGRSTTVHAYSSSDLPLELGASIFVKVNRILVDAAESFNLTSTSLSPSSLGKSDIPGPALGIWDGKALVVVLQNEGGWWDTAKLLYKYGLAPIRTMNLMKATVAKFLQMYDEPIFPFASLTQAVRDVGLSAVTASTGEQYLRENNIGSLFGREVVQASTRVNYAQNLETIHGLEAMVCMAAEGAMAIEGGNWQLFARMIEAANATAELDSAVTALEQQKDGSWLVQSTVTATTSDVRESTLSFDEVILAAPMQFANLAINITSFSSTTIRLPQVRPYVHLHVTLFTSPHLLSPTFFNLPGDKAAPHAVLTTLPQSEHPSLEHQAGSPGFFSISLLRSLTNPRTGHAEYVYKIFSPEAVNSTFLASILDIPASSSSSSPSEENVTWTYRKEWDSYPFETPRDSFDDVKLGEGLWYTSGIENFISTMETSALMGRNVARLVVDGWVAEREREKRAEGWKENL